jgi:hypothetical protein
MHLVSPTLSPLLSVQIRNGGGHSATFEALHREHQEVADYLLQVWCGCEPRGIGRGVSTYVNARDSWSWLWWS